MECYEIELTRAKSFASSPPFEAILTQEPFSGTGKKLQSINQPPTNVTECLDARAMQSMRGCFDEFQSVGLSLEISIRESTRTPRNAGKRSLLHTLA